VFLGFYLTGSCYQEEWLVIAYFHVII